MNSTPVPARPAGRSVPVLSRAREYADARRARVGGRRELQSVLAGHHGDTMREELLAVLGRS